MTSGGACRRRSHQLRDQRSGFDHRYGDYSLPQGRVRLTLIASLIRDSRLLRPGNPVCKRCANPLQTLTPKHADRSCDR